MKAWERIGEAIAAAFAKTEARFRDEFLENYRQRAEVNFKHWMEYLAAPDRISTPTVRGYVRYTPAREYDREPRTIAERQAQADRYSPDFTRAAADAIHHYEDAREQFLYKNTTKLRAVLGDRDDLIDGRVEFGYERGAFGGTVTVQLSDASFVADVGVKYVFRTIPKYTPYFQYPLLFRAVRIGSQPAKGMSEREVAEALGTSVGGESVVDREKRAARETKVSARIERDRLQTIKYRLSDVADRFHSIELWSAMRPHADTDDRRAHLEKIIAQAWAEIPQLAAKAGVAPPTSRKEVRALIKAVSDQLKALKGK